MTSFQKYLDILIDVKKTRNETTFNDKLITEYSSESSNEYRFVEDFATYFLGDWLRFHGYNVILHINFDGTVDNNVVTKDVLEIHSGDEIECWKGQDEFTISVFFDEIKVFKCNLEKSCNCEEIYEHIAFNIWPQWNTINIKFFNFILGQDKLVFKIVRYIRENKSKFKNFEILCKDISKLI